MSNFKTRLALIGIVAAFLTGCAGASSDTSTCPPWPVAGPKVAEELETVPYAGHEDLWGWLGRLDKLRDQLEACRR